jgi:Ser/Thr protein kinase RdoA (MazF antagonist)
MQAIHRTVLFCLVTVLYALDSFLCYLDPKLSGLLGLSDVYLIETQAQPYILRVSHHHWRSKAEINFELELLDFLKQRQIPVAYPLKTKDGQLSIEITAPEGKRYASLFIYAPGKIALGDLNPVQGRKLGETVAQLHQAAIDFCPQYQRQPLNIQYLLDESVQAILPFLQNSHDRQCLLETVDKIKHQLQDFPQEPPYWGICWGDPHSGNAHFTPNNEVTLFDFDQCGYGWRTFELGKFLQVSLNTGVSPRVRDAFLGGYQAIQPLAESELVALQPFTQMAHIWAWAISLNAAIFHNYCRLDERYFYHHLERLKMLKSPEWYLF